MACSLMVHHWIVEHAVYAINEPKDLKSLYVCPVYKKPRHTDLTYIFPLLLQSGKADPEHWILRGVALLCDTKYKINKFYEY